ncbi:efflux RND transporter permease subunit [Malikia spinosa]|uniref:Efflux RND transporter permease subunit n=1 Tax=Malikia spinosa TaxID=86180 RepID=A0A7C9IXS2_9BURK|nr:efflux RND transporter permease subunit [Malikia spinosa]MYZ52232.1 efflux RND transporter permease subunit [Malikia spinosa]
MKSFNLSEWAVTHRAMVLFMIIGSLLVGTFAFTRLGRLEDPQFMVPTMTAVVAWPGASAQQVQDQVLNRMERELQKIEGVDFIRSFSRQGYGAVNLWMKGGTPKAELERAWYQARKKIGDVRHQFPEGVQGPLFNDEFSDVYSVMYAISAADLSWPELQVLTEDLKRQVQAQPGVTKVDVFGRQAEKVHVEFSSQRLASLGISAQTVIEALARQNTVSPSGSTEGRIDRVFVRVDGTLRDARDVANVSITAGGKLLRLGDVAKVSAGLEDPPSFTVRHDGKPVLMLAITFDKHGNILALGRELESRMEALKASLPMGVVVEKVADQPSIVEESVWEFESSFLEALAIVLAVCFLFLGWRTGIVVAASVPLVLAIVAIVMLAAGWSLDRISLGALIIALGLLVDDAIIAVEMMVVKIEQGWDRVSAATFAYTSTAFPMLTGTLVTVAGFMPVGFAKSISGEYAGGIFWVVGVALIASWFVAVVFTPYLGIVLLPKTMKAHGGAAPDPYAAPLYQRLRRLLQWCMAHRVMVLAATTVLFVSAVAGMGLVQQQFFPTASRLELIVDLRLREGASFAATEAQVKRFEQVLKDDGQVQHFSAYTGAGAPRFFLSLPIELPNPSYAQIVIKTANVADREAVRRRLLDLFAAERAFPDLRGRVTRFEFGPPVGFPVQFRVVGPDTGKVRQIAYQVRDAVRQSPLVRDTQLDWNEQVRTLRVQIDQDKARLLGITSADISAMMQTVLSGAPATQIRRGEDLIDVTVRAAPSERLALEQLGDVSLFTRSGAVVPLSQVATLVPTFEEPVLWRRNRDMVLTVRSDVHDGVQGPSATMKIWPSLKPIIDKLPPGYRIEQGGAIEESDKSNQALFAVFPLMLVVMLLILMVQLQSFSRMWMVFLTAPLGLIGVVPALLIFNAPFGFVALLGVIALGGMIMRNAVILVDQIDSDIASGMPQAQAVVEATVRRSRPVVLTAAAAVLAMVPLTGSIFWGPMAMAIMGGLIAATVLTLVFVPALYMVWMKPSGPGEPDAQAAPSVSLT